MTERSQISKIVSGAVRVKIVDVVIK